MSVARSRKPPRLGLPATSVASRISRSRPNPEPGVLGRPPNGPIVDEAIARHGPGQALDAQFRAELDPPASQLDLRRALRSVADRHGSANAKRNRLGLRVRHDPSRSRHANLFQPSAPRELRADRLRKIGGRGAANAEARTRWCRMPSSCQGRSISTAASTSSPSMRTGQVVQQPDSSNFSRNPSISRGSMATVSASPGKLPHSAASRNAVTAAIRSALICS